MADVSDEIIREEQHDQLEGRHARSGEVRIREDELGLGGAGAGTILLEALPTRCACRLLVISLAVELSSSLDLEHMDLEMGIVAEAVVFIFNSSERFAMGEEQVDDRRLVVFFVFKLIQDQFDHDRGSEIVSSHNYSSFHFCTPPFPRWTFTSS